MPGLSGIRQALDLIPQDEPFILSWCDLLFSQKTEIPNSIDCNLIALSKSFECRWSFDDNQFTKTPSKEKGVAGLFLLKNKQQIIDIGNNTKIAAIVYEAKLLSLLSVKKYDRTLEASREVANTVQPQKA